MPAGAVDQNDEKLLHKLEALLQKNGYTQINADFFAELGSPGGASKVGQTDNDPQAVKDLAPQGED